MTTPPVTTVSLRPDRVGDEAVDLLIALINARTGVDRRRLVQPVLVPRQSTLRPARGIRARAEAQQGTNPHRSPTVGT
jgi:DNA-binding LacI/PurR family transcriptional regulator